MTRTIPFPPAPEPGWYEDDALPVADARPAHQHELVEDIESIADAPFDAEALDGAGGGIPAPLAAALSDADDAYPATSAAIPLSTVPMTLRGDAAAPSFHTSGRPVTPVAAAPVSAADAAPAASAPVFPDASSAASPAAGAPVPADTPAPDADDATAAPVGRHARGAEEPSDRPASPAAPRRTYLLRNDSTHQSIVVDASMLLGRRPSNPVPDGAKIVQLEDPTRTISRNHATITMDEDGRLWLDDCDSLNGTYLVVDGHDRKIAPGEAVAVVAPAVIRFGDQLFDLTEA